MKYKAELTLTDEGWKIISYSNRLIPLNVLRELNNAVHDAIDKINGKTAWKNEYIKFTHEGKSYEQIDEIHLCDGCIFRKDNLCIHPHYSDGTKGNCNNKIYKECNN